MTVCVGFLLGIPLLIGFTLSRLVADPFYEFVLAFDANAFALSDRAKVEGAHEVHLHEMRLRMDAAIGKAPPLGEDELQVHIMNTYWKGFSAYKCTSLPDNQNLKESSAMQLRLIL